MATTPPPPLSPLIRTITLHLISPNSEVPERLIFNDVPVTETLADLKRRIQNVVPSKPVPERQRIIYRGRALVAHNATIESILGPEALTANAPFTFHLVLTPNPQPDASNPARPDGLHQPMGLPALPAIPMHHLGTHNIQMPPRPASTSQIPEGLQQLPPNMQPFNPLLGMIPPGFQPGVNIHPPGLQPGVNIHMQWTQTGLPMHPPPGGIGSLPHVPLHALGTIPGMPSMHELLLHQQRLHQHNHHDAADAGQPMTGRQTAPTTQDLSRDPSTTRAELDTRIPRPVNTSPSNLATGSDRTPRSHSANRPFQPRAMQAAIHQNHIQNMHIDQMGQFAQLQNALLNPLRNIRPPAPATNQTVYLLSSPRGPEALLLSPGGTFTTPGYGMVQHLPAINPGLGAAPTTAPQARIPTPTPTVPADTIPQTPRAQRARSLPPAQAARQAPQAPQPQLPQQAQQQQEDQMGDMLRILLPLGGHLWLLVRLVGFVYLFSGGRGWSNTIMLGLIAVFLFLAHLGFFNPLISNIWQPLRQHVEGIINSGHPRPRPIGIPTPQQVAERLVEERQANESILRRTLRRAERATILFVASLIPGVGESQVRARERAEREAREAEEAAERARLETIEQARNQEEKTDGVGGAKNEVEAEPSQAQIEIDAAVD